MSSNEWLVSRRSALGYFVDVPDLRGGTGHGMTTEKLDRLFCEYLEQHGSPATIINEIAKICFDPTTMEAFVEAETETVSRILLPLMPEDQNIEGACRFLIQLFLREFPLRPLRSVKNVREALEKYVHRRIEEMLQ